MKKFISIAAGLIVASAAFAHEGHDHATGVVKERMIAMTSMGQSLLAISKRLRADQDLAKVADDAHVIHELAGKLPPQFPTGSTQYPTAAKPEIWQNWPDFEARAKKLEMEAGKLMSLPANDGKEIRVQFRAVAQACDGCHEVYRRPK